MIWADSASRFARPIRLDNEGRIIASVWSAVPTHSYDRAEVLIVRTGAVYIHARLPELRGEMPEWFLLLRRWHQAKLFFGPVSASLRVSCMFCKAVVGVFGEALRGLDEPGMDRAFNCALCSCVWHERCFREFSNAFYGGAPFFR